LSCSPLLSSYCSRPSGPKPMLNRPSIRNGLATLLALRRGFDQIPAPQRPNRTRRRSARLGPCARRHLQTHRGVNPNPVALPKPKAGNVKASTVTFHSFDLRAIRKTSRNLSLVFMVTMLTDFTTPRHWSIATYSHQFLPLIRQSSCAIERLFRHDSPSIVLAGRRIAHATCWP